MEYTTEEKQEFLKHVTSILTAMEKINAMDAHIINEVGLSAYPFGESFDALTVKVWDWASVIESESNVVKTDTAMENIAVLDGMTRAGWSGQVIDRVENTLNTHGAMLTALKAARVTLGDDEIYAQCKETYNTVDEAIKKAEGK